MSIAIDSHIPVPAGRSKHSEYRAAMQTMQVGQSFITKSPPTIYAYKKQITPPASLSSGARARLFAAGVRNKPPQSL